ncbi:ATP-binding protein [Runella sp.]|uniref:ATP-binding protein n=1 Tax=Runella sp. TaxID=1960881 RepID=UPI003D10F1A6
MNWIELDFAKAKTRHILFKTQLRAILYGAQIDELPVVSPHECGFGKWIYEYALPQYGHIPEMHVLEKIHTNLHTCAEELIKLYKNNQPEIAREGLLKMESIAQELTALLAAVEKHSIDQQKEPGKEESPGELTIHYKELLDLHVTIQQLDERIREQIVLSMQARKEAQESETKFDNIVQQVPVGITILQGPEFIVEMANDTYLQIVDRSRSAFVGRSLFDSLPEVKTAVQPLLEEVMSTGFPYYGNEFEVPLNRFGKKEATFFNFVYQPLRDAEQNVTGIIVVANEVTNLVNAKHIFEQSESRFRNLVMQSPIAMTIFKGRDYLIDLANETLVTNIWRRKYEEVQGKKLFDVFPELIGQPFPQLLDQVFNTGITYREKEALAYVEGDDGMKKFYLDFEYAPLFDTEKVVSSIMVTVYDVTEKAEARKKIEDTEERLRIAVEATDLGTFEANLKTGKLDASKRFLEIFDFAEEAPADHVKFIKRIHPNDLDIRQKAHALSYKTGILNYEFRVVHRDQSLHWVKVKGKVEFDDQKEPARILGTVLDVTEEKQSRQLIEESENRLRMLAGSLEIMVEDRTQELVTINNQLEKTNTELAQFAYVASHDLQEPLRKIQTLASRIAEIEKDNLTEKGSDYFRRMQTAATRMQQLILDLLVYSRTNTSEKHFEPVNLNVLLQSVKDHLNEQIEQKQAIIQSSFLPVLEVIPFQFEQLFTNLISNSLKFLKPDTPLQITVTYQRLHGIPIQKASPHVEYHLITFSDNGIGFDPQFSERIFQVFQRLHSKDAYEGTGIGLAICKKIIENHHGFITATSEPGKGATFFMYLPVEN